MNILELYTSSSNLLKNKGILTYKLDVKILLSFLLGIDSRELISHFDKNINDLFIKEFNILLNRRLNNEPIANIIERKAFWNHDFFVNENVLTPRNDSETLIEAVLDNFKNTDAFLRIMDLGTGSGCLVLTLLKIYKNASAVAVDISDEALKIAKINADNLGIYNIKFLKGNWNDNIDDKFDIIISNPPYIPTNEIASLEPEVNRFNPLISLDGGIDGLDFYRYFSKNLIKNLKNTTQLFLEIGKGQHKDVISIFERSNYKLTKIYKDLAGINRVLCFVYDYIYINFIYIGEI